MKILFFEFVKLIRHDKYCTKYTCTPDDFNTSYHYHVHLFFQEMALYATLHVHHRLSLHINVN